MNYLPIKYEKKITEFPTNAELEANGLSANWIILKTRLSGDEQLKMAAIEGLSKLAEDGTTIVQALNTPEVIVKLISVLIKDWSFTDYETGSKYEINDVNIASLYQEDFNYLINEFANVMNTINGGQQVAPNGEEPTLEQELLPHTALSVTEKNSLPSGSGAGKKQPEIEAVVVPAQA